jgi:hypothetical protein
MRDADFVNESSCFRRVKTAALENRCAVSFCTEITFTFFPNTGTLGVKDDQKAARGTQKQAGC